MNIERKIQTLVVAKTLISRGKVNCMCDAIILADFLSLNGIKNNPLEMFPEIIKRKPKELYFTDEGAEIWFDLYDSKSRVDLLDEVIEELKSQLKQQSNENQS